MAWIYLAELVESELHSNLGLEQSPIVSVTDTLRVSYCPGCDQVKLTELQSGTTLQPSEEICCQGLTSYSAAFLARISALRAVERAWMESEAVFSSKLLDSPESANLDLFSSKMSLPSEPVEGKEWLKNWPRSGMTVDGLLYRPPQLEPHTSETGGFCWPTPSATEGGPLPPDTNYRPNQRSYNLRTGKHTQITLRRAVQMCPAPSAIDSCRGPGKHYDPKSKRQSDRTLVTYAKKAHLWATPNTMDSLPPRSLSAMKKTTLKNRPGRSAPANLREQVNIEMYREIFPTWPTPTAQDFKKRGPNSKQQGLSNKVFLPTPAELERNSTTLATIAGGQLNPQWVEWLMGYRTEYTELDALATAWFHSKSERRSKSLQELIDPTP